jgi:hypothetical protein
MALVGLRDDTRGILRVDQYHVGADCFQTLQPFMELADMRRQGPVLQHGIGAELP